MGIRARLAALIAAGVLPPAVEAEAALPGLLSRLAWAEW